MRDKYQFWLHLILILTLIISTTLVGVPIVPVSAQTTRVYVDPPSTTNVAPSGTFTVYVKVENPVDLMGFEFKLKYKTSVLTTTAQKVTIGNIFGTSYMQFKKDVNDTIGYVWLGVAKSATPGVSEPGPFSLAKIIFTVDSYGGSCLSLSDTSKLGELYKSDTALTDSEQNLFPPDIVEDGHFVNSPVHDIAITSVTPPSPYPTAVIQGQTVDVNVVARNHGNFTESFTVAAYANTTTAIGTPQTVTDLAPGSRIPLTFTWDTTGVSLGRHIISANATTVQDETDTTDNTYNTAYDFNEKTYTYVTITVIDYPTAAFNYSPNKPLVKQQVSFNASESTPNGGKINTYQWDFGDGNTTGASVSPIAHNVFVHHGIFTVTLTVTDSEGLTNTTSKPITIYLPDVVALINVTAYPTEVTKPQPVSINATVTNNGVSSETFDVTVYYDSTPIDTQTVANLGPGATTTLNFTWDTTYVPATITGTNYTISAIATEISYELNTTNNEFIDSTVTVYKPPGPSASFTYSPENPIEGQPVNFNASLSTQDPKTNASITRYAWDFDDGTKEIYIGANLTDTATHSYAKARSYTVKLNVTDSNGLSDATQKNVTVYRHDITIVSVTPHKIEAKIGEPISIDVTVKNEGNFTETFNVKAYYDNTETGTINVPNLASGASTMLAFTWDTTNVNPGVYTIKANATVVEGETKTDNNEKVFDGTVTLKFGSTISISATPTSLMIGKSTIINGQIDPLRDGVTVTIKYRLSGEVTWNTLPTVPTNATSQYLCAWTPPTIGTYELKASWDGDANTLAAESNIQSITVNKVISAISLTTSETSIQFGSSIAINGAISPVREHETVTIYYKPSGGTWSNLTASKTNATSQYSYTWTPTTVGTFQFKASWEGDDDTLPAESDPATVTVNKMSSVVSIILSSTSITLESNITISGEIVPARVNVPVTIYYKFNGGTWTSLPTATTDSNSQYSYTWTPTTFGTHELKASWSGDASTLQDESTIVTLTVKAPPVTSFTYDPLAPIVGDIVTFTSTSTDPDGSIQSSSWNFGDGAQSVGHGVTVTHAYVTAGDFLVTLNVTDNHGLTGTKSIMVTVNAAPQLGPPLYVMAAAVGAIVIIIACIAYYILRRKH